MADNNLWPLLPPKSTESRLLHFDETVYKVDQGTLLYQLIDAMAGDGGVGTVKGELLLQRLSVSLEGMSGSTLDHIFGNVRMLSRTSAESYTYEPETGSLTSDQWDEVMVKDALFRSRIREFFAAATRGGTAEAIRLAVHAATSSDCQVVENWRWIDNFGLEEGVGRLVAFGCAAVELATGYRVYYSVNGIYRTWFVGETAEEARNLALAFINGRPGWGIEECRARNEMTVVPHKTDYSPAEARTLRDMLDRITPQDSVITVDPNGLAVNTPVQVRAITADSSYFQVEKVIASTPDLDSLPPPELLAIDLDPTEKWLFSKSKELAPYAKYNITSEYGYWYLLSGGSRSPIDSVTYGTLQADGTVAPEPAFSWYEQVDNYGPWQTYEITTNPAYPTQADYVAARKAEVIAAGGEADDYQYRLPINSGGNDFKRTYTADLAIAIKAPTRESTVTTSWTSRRPRTSLIELRNPILIR